MSEIVVRVVRYGQTYLRMKYTDPVTNKPVVRSCGTKDRIAAERMAAVWEAALREGRFKPVSKVTWQEFRTRYESEKCPSLAVKTRQRIATVFNSVEKLINPDRLVKLTSDQLSRYQRLLREQVRVTKAGKTMKLSEASIKTTLTHLRAALAWAKKVGLLATVPAVELPTRKAGKLAKGRPLATEEFERMLAKIPEVVCGIIPPKDGESPVELPPDKAAKLDEIAANWRWFLKALWYSGLRLGEALALSWDQQGFIRVDLSDRFAMFEIPANRQKSGRDEVLPIRTKEVITV